MYLHMEALKDVGTIGAFNQVSAKLCGFLRLAGYVPELAQDEWWELVKDKMKTLYASYLNNDGSYTEATSGYMGGVVTELRTALELIALRDGEEDPCYNSLLEFYRKLVKYIFDMAMPYGRTTPYGDGPAWIPRRSVITNIASIPMWIQTGILNTLLQKDSLGMSLTILQPCIKTRP